MPTLQQVLIVALSCVLLAPSMAAQSDGSEAEAAWHLSHFGAGSGPREHAGQFQLLDSEGSFGQSNAVAFERDVEGAFEWVRLTCRLRVQEGGDGGAFLFLNTEEYGEHGPAPYVPSWVEPKLRKSLAVAIDVHNPLNEEPFSEWGNYQGLPEREVSLHWDGRELVKCVAETEFRGDWVDVEIHLQHVVGGAEVSVQLGESLVFDRSFVPGAVPYPIRPAIGAGSRADMATQFDVAELVMEHGEPALATRRPLHVEVFNHVLTDNSTTSYEAEVELPPSSWAFGRVVLTLDIHDAGKDWDEWDRRGDLYVFDEEGQAWDILPFITSYRTECHWELDVTHFRPLLSGKTRFKIAAGTNFYKNRGYMMSVSLDFHHGEPLLDGEPLEAFSVVPLWHGTAQYRNDENHFSDFFEAQAVSIPAETKAARVTTTTTGHSQIGEFTASERELVFVADAVTASEPVRFANTLWKADCYLNPNRPQFGTWKYSRAGWAPGDIVHPWWVDLTPHLIPGATAEISYVSSPYDFSELAEDGRPSAGQVGEASHVVRSFLVLYRTPQDTVAAPLVRVTNVVGGSAAAEAGIQQGDYLSSYDGVPVDSVPELSAAKAAATEAGKERVPVVVFRGSERLELEMATGQMGVNLATP